MIDKNRYVKKPEKYIRISEYAASTSRWIMMQVRKDGSLPSVPASPLLRSSLNFHLLDCMKPELTETEKDFGKNLKIRRRVVAIESKEC